MVNSSKAFVFQTAEDICFEKELNQSNHQIDRHKLETFNKTNNIQQFTRTDPQAEMYHETLFDQQQVMMQTSYFDAQQQAKPSPSFMDHDVQFNYPTEDKNFTLCDEFTAHVKPEPSYQNSNGFPHSLGSTPPTMQRQYSINTVMEVIENHQISEIGSAQEVLPQAVVQTEPNRSSQTQPININTQPLMQNAQCNGTINAYVGPADPQCRMMTVTVPPASDVRAYNQYGCSPAYSNISASPGPCPFTRYQEEMTPQDQSAGFHTACASTMYRNDQSYNASNDRPSTALQASEDVMSPGSVVLSPYKWEEQNHAACLSDPFSPDPQQTTQCSETDYPAFSTMPCYEYSQSQFKPSQSCPNFGNSSFRPRHRDYSESGSHHAPRSHLTSTSSTVDEFFEAESPFNAALEEIDYSTFTNEIGPPLPEQERMDRRRIRNNLACRASRERRKKRKADREALAGYLEDENKELKDRIKRLERDVKVATETVRRRMSQS